MFDVFRKLKSYDINGSQLALMCAYHLSRPFTITSCETAEEVLRAFMRALSSLNAYMYKIYNGDVNTLFYDMREVTYTANEMCKAIYDMRHYRSRMKLPPLFYEVFNYHVEDFLLLEPEVRQQQFGKYFARMAQLVDEQNFPPHMAAEPAHGEAIKENLTNGNH